MWWIVWGTTNFSFISNLLLCKIQVIWDVVLCHWVNSSRKAAVLQNIGNSVTSDIVQRTGWHESLAMPLWQPQKLQLLPSYWMASLTQIHTWYSAGRPASNIVTCGVLRLYSAISAACAALLMSLDFVSPVQPIILARAADVESRPEVITGTNADGSIHMASWVRNVRLATFTLELGVCVGSTRNRITAFICSSGANDSLQEKWAIKTAQHYTIKGGKPVCVHKANPFEPYSAMQTLKTCISIIINALMTATIEMHLCHWTKIKCSGSVEMFYY